VTIVRVVYNPPDELKSRNGETLLHFLNYIVESEMGGAMRAMGESLSPGSVLDRIVEAIDEDMS
jgi:hypothetical protein